MGTRLLVERPLMLISLDILLAEATDHHAPTLHFTSVLSSHARPTSPAHDETMRLIKLQVFRRIIISALCFPSHPIHLAHLENTSPVLLSITLDDRAKDLLPFCTPLARDWIPPRD